MKNLFSNKGLAYIAMACVMFLSSCKDNNKIDFTSNDASNIEGETTSDAFTSDATDISTDAVDGYNDTQLSGGRVDEVASFATNDRLKCAKITLTKTGTDPGSVAGVITIEFPADGTCADSRGNVRKGIITITYTGRKFVAGSKIVTTFTNYSVNGVKVEGTHTLTNITATTNDYPRFTASISGGKLTFLDGKTVTREQEFTREWQRAKDPTQDKWVLFKGSKAAGTTRNSTTYTMEVTIDIVHSRACQISNKVFIAVSGEKRFTTENKLIVVNYGDGSCDNIVTVTINGKTRDVTIKGDGN